MIPSSRMTSAGMGLRENWYVSGDFHFFIASSSGTFSGAVSAAVVFRRLLIVDDSISIPHYYIVSHTASREVKHLQESESSSRVCLRRHNRLRQVVSFTPDLPFLLLRTAR